MYFTLTGNITAIANSANNWTVTATVQGDTQNFAGVTNQAEPHYAFVCMGSECNLYRT